MDEYFPRLNKNTRQQRESLKHKFAWVSIAMNFGKVSVLHNEACSNTAPLDSIVYEPQK